MIIDKRIECCYRFVIDLLISRRSKYATVSQRTHYAHANVLSAETCGFIMSDVICVYDRGTLPRWITNVPNLDVVYDDRESHMVFGEYNFQGFTAAFGGMGGWTRWVNFNVFGVVTWCADTVDPGRKYTLWRSGGLYPQSKVPIPAVGSVGVFKHSPRSPPVRMRGGGIFFTDVTRKLETLVRQGVVTLRGCFIQSCSDDKSDVLRNCLYHKLSVLLI